MWSKYSVGTVSSGETALDMGPKILPSPNQRGVMFVHGAGSGAAYCIDTYGLQSTLTNMVCEAGFNCFSGDIGGPNTWGNSTAMSRMTTAYNHTQSMYGTASGKVALISGSMGALTSLNWAAANPSKVSCILSVIPVINPNDIAVNNRSGYGSSINAAYSGGWSQAVYGANYNPQTLVAAGAFYGLPIMFFYGLADTLCMPAETQAFSAASGYCTLIPLSTGHEEASYANINRYVAVEFLKASAA